MRSSRRHGPLDHVLIAGDATELPSIRALLALLPAATYGQVYVEVAADTEPPVLDTPARVTAAVLPRRREQDPGDRLTGAVDGWLAEWAPEEPDPDRSVAIWLGASVGARIQTAATCLERL